MRTCAFATIALLSIATSAVAEQKISRSAQPDVVISTQNQVPVGSASSNGAVIVGLLGILLLVAIAGGSDGGSQTPVMENDS